MTTDPDRLTTSLGIALTKIHALLDERLPKPCIGPDVTPCECPGCEPTEARYEREDAEARQDDPLVVALERVGERPGGDYAALARGARKHIYVPLDERLPKTDRHDELVALLTEIRDRLPEAHDPVGSQCRRDYCEEMHDPAPADDLPGEPVEPGDLRAGDKVAFTWEGTGERIIGALASDQGGDVLRSDTPDSEGYHPNVVGRDSEWCGGISDVRLIERAPRQDEDEREDTEARHDDPVSTEDRLRAALDSAAAQTHRARRAEAERDEWREVAARYEDGRDKWQAKWRESDEARERAEAKHAALRADVEALRRNPKSFTDVLMRAADVIDRDDERTPQADPDTVTLRRDDLTEPSILRLAAADLRDNHHLGINGLPRSLPATLYKLADAMEAGQ